MKKNTLFIVGGSQEQTFIKIGKKQNCNILFHPGKVRNGGVKSAFRKSVKNADCVVVLCDALMHETMYQVKDLCKEYETKVVFHTNGFGASGAIAAGLGKLKAA
ncbi:MAG: DUF2325 domain-containing protein [Planococcus donghaensis]